MRDKNISKQQPKPMPRPENEVSKRVGGSSDVEYGQYPKPEPIKPPSKKD